MAYSLDLRQRTVVLYEELGSANAVAKLLKVSHTFVGKLVKQWQKTGSLDTHYENNGRPPKITAKAKQWLCDWLAEQNDLTIKELRSRLRQQKIKVGPTAIHNALAALNITRKKKQLLPPNNGDRKSKRREKNGTLKPSPLSPPIA